MGVGGAILSQLQLHLQHATRLTIFYPRCKSTHDTQLTDPFFIPAASQPSTCNCRSRPFLSLLQLLPRYAIGPTFFCISCKSTLGTQLRSDPCFCPGCESKPRYTTEVEPFSLSQLHLHTQHEIAGHLFCPFTHDTQLRSNQFCSGGNSTLDTQLWIRPIFLPVITPLSISNRVSAVKWVMLKCTTNMFQIREQF